VAQNTRYRGDNQEKTAASSFFENLSGVAASRQSAAVFARKQEIGGALPSAATEF
jgi:hypothetical protein